jgi:hypothetical protein
MTSSKNIYIPGLALLGLGGLFFAFYQGNKKTKHQPYIAEEGELLTIE